MSNGQPSSNRQIAIGTSVAGSAVVAGDGNTITVTTTEIIQISIDEIKTRQLNLVLPYKGLKKFEERDSDRFFGRDQFLDDLLKRLEQEQTNFILLLGASGSGKSSLIRAGLVPKLHKKWGDTFESLIFTPDNDPFESLYASLLTCRYHYKQSEAQIAKVAADDTLSQVVQQLRPPDAFWLIFIDQFEELFTLSDTEKCRCFIKSLVQLSQISSPLVKVVATMRADFFDRLSSYPNLVKLPTFEHLLLTEMQDDELRLAIEQPAAHHGVVFERGLVEEIINSVQGRAGCLPLLQYTLALLWDTEVKDEGIRDRTLNITSYRCLGGVRGALQQRVNDIYNALSESEQLATQRIFLKMVEIGGNTESGTEWKPVRRRAKRSEFSDKTEETVLAQLIDANLLISDATTVDGATVEIAHEILLTSWTTLKTWIQDNRQAIALRNRLYDDVRTWIQENKRDDDLWHGAKLVRVIELKDDSNFNQVIGSFSVEAIDFINASQELINRKLYEQKQREHEQKQRELKVRIAVGDERRAALLELLETCTVKLSIPGQVGWSTGFFVAPGKILTCAPKIVEAGDQRIKVSWQDQENFDEATLDHLHSNNLAVLKLTSVSNHPCVYLDETSSVNDPICTYGYADEFVKGGYGRGKLQKKTGKKQGMIEFETYQDSSKLQSSPLLNLETAKVCGIVRSTHDSDKSAPDQNIVTVGKAISAATILASIDGLKQEQREFHKKDHHWSHLLPPRCKPRTIALASLGMTTLVILVRAFQVFQPLELGFYDALMRTRFNPPKPSDRFLIVHVTRQDAEAQENRGEVLTYSLSNETLARLLQKIETLKPIAVGLDVYREQTLTQLAPSEKQHLKTLFQQPELFTVCKAPDQQEPDGVLPPPGTKLEQVGFSDVSIDNDGILRRHLLAFYPSDSAHSKCSSSQSFGLLIATRYLQSRAEKIITEVHISEESCQVSFSNSVMLPNLQPSTGGYQGYAGDTSTLFNGCQTLLNYREQQENQLYKTVTLEEFLKPSFPAQDYNNRIILIGIDRSDGISDNFRTPYDQSSDQVTTGVVIQAHMIDQIIDTALKKNSLIWVLPSQVDLLLIAIFAFVGGGLGWWFLSPRQLGMVVVLSGGGVLLISIAVFQLGGWVPLMPQFLALSATSGYVFWANARLRSITSAKPAKRQLVNQDVGRLSL
jgi:CHASE2 domain-containing sensor protein/energy-coupling factor transporter ATP-binding protein EcfA2